MQRAASSGMPSSCCRRSRLRIGQSWCTSIAPRHADTSGLVSDIMASCWPTSRCAIRLTCRVGAQVPRIARQGVANRLAGQHLVLALSAAGEPLTSESVCDNHQLCKSAVQAALAQELEIYKKCFGKQVWEVCSRAGTSTVVHAAF